MKGYLCFPSLHQHHERSLAAFAIRPFLRIVCTKQQPSCPTSRFFAAFATMCIFTWDRWSCGHVEKTRIEYCDHARDLTPKQRDCYEQCHKPSACPELNNHISERCKECCHREGSSGSSGSLPYIALDAQGQAHYKYEQERRAIRREILQTQCELRHLRATCTHAATASINFLSTELRNGEDQYRDLGARYYGCAWFATVDREDFRDARQVSINIADALHGYNVERSFLQPWRDLERSISVALHHLAMGESTKAYHTCYYRAFPAARAMTASLHQLKTYINIIEAEEIGPAGERRRFVGPGDCDAEARDRAM